jgi:hypothetical protein
MITGESQNWSIEKELLKLSGESRIDQAVVSLGLVPEGQHLGQIEGTSSWISSGSETYLYHFAIVYNSGDRRELILKAVTTFCPASSLESKLKEWIFRRGILSERGIFVPQLFFSGHGVILEEFIPRALGDVLCQAESHDKLLSELFYYAGTLLRLGFSPIEAFADLRTDGNHVYVVDFGEDLGPISVDDSNPLDLYTLAVRAVRSYGTVLSFDQLSNYHAKFLLGRYGVLEN